jgi:hypothetical protein
MQNKAFSTVGIIIILLILIGGGYFAWQHFGVPKASIMDWIGSYEYIESAPGVYSPDQTWVYKLDIYEEENQLKAQLDIDGFQAMIRIQAIAEERNGRLDIVFDSYRSENIYELYERGDLLFSIEKISRDKYRILWDKMKSNLLEPGDAKFEKVQ